MKKYYYELRYPQSVEDSDRNCVWMSKQGLLDDALSRIDYLIDDVKAGPNDDDVKLLTAYKSILQNDIADFDLIKFPILKDVYNYDDQVLIRRKNKAFDR